MTMFRSTKGASKQRRDLINAEIVKLRELLPLSEAGRQRLSQLQVMSYASVYIRKNNYFARLFGKTTAASDKVPYQFSQSLDGFHLAVTNCGKLLYVSQNVIEYLGHSSVDMMTQGDTLFDIVDRRDHAPVEAFLLRGGASDEQEELTFFCRMTVSRNFRRQTGYGDHKVMHVRGRFVTPKYLDQYSNQLVFLATCRPFVTPEVNESSVVNSTSFFQSVHRLDMNYIEMAPNGCHYLGYADDDIRQKSWYELLHPDDVMEAREKHKQLIQSSREMGCMLTARLQAKTGEWLWVSIVLHVRQPFSGDSADAAIVCTNQVLLDDEAPLFKMQGQLYSSQVARSPEFPPMDDGRVQIIAQRPQTEMMSPLLTLDADQSPLYSGEFLGMSCNPGQGEQQPFADGLFPFGDDLPLNDNRKISLKKDIIRAGLLRKLKRKASEMAVSSDQNVRGACQPAKRTRHLANGDSGSHGHRLPYIGSILGTNEQRMTSRVISAVNGGTQVMNVVQEDRVYTHLMMKKDIGISQETLRLPTSDPQVEITMTALNSLRNLTPPCDVSPLTPESLVSDCGSPNSMSDLAIDVTEPLLPFSLTPEPSPVHSSSDYPLTPPSVLSPGCEQRVPSLVGDFEDNIFSDADQDLFQELLTPPPEKPAVVSPNCRLPVLDVTSVNQYLGDIEEKKSRRKSQLFQFNDIVETICSNQLKIGHTTDVVQQLQCADVDTKVTQDDIDQFMMVPGGTSLVSSPQKSDQCGTVTGSDVSDEVEATPSIFTDVMNELAELEVFANSAVFGSDSKMCGSLFDQTL